MSQDPYVTAKIAEAIASAGGDAAAAQRLLIKACGRDDRLLRTLVAPFIKGIVAHAVQRAGGKVKPGAAKPRAAKPVAQRLSAEALDDVIGQLGQRIGTRTQPSGMTALVNPPTKTPAGEVHQQSLRRLATAFARKRLEGR